MMLTDPNKYKVARCPQCGSTKPETFVVSLSAASFAQNPTWRLCHPDRTWHTWHEKLGWAGGWDDRS